jgi:electron transport complex protein RnfG
MNRAGGNEVDAVWPMYRALVGIGMLCGVLIVVFYQATRGVVERNREASLEAAVLAVLPSAARLESFVLTAEGNIARAEDPGGERLHAGFDAAGRLIGFAIEANGMGYADTIRLMYGYDPAQEAIVGLKVLASKETPGLGSRIMTDANFLANFDNLDVRLDDADENLRNEIVSTGKVAATEPWQIDTITGATVSSVAVADIVNASASRWLPVIRRQLSSFREGSANGD